MLKKQDTLVAYGLIATGTIQLILLLIVMIGFKGDSFNSFLYNAFHISAIYIPMLQYFGAYLIIKRPLNKVLFYYSIASIFIFFPVAILIKILFSDKKDPVITFLHSAFDSPNKNWGSVFVLLGIISILILSSRIIVKGLLLEEEDDIEKDSLDKKSNDNNPFDLEDLDIEADIETDIDHDDSAAEEAYEDDDQDSYEENEPEEDNEDLYEENEPEEEENLTLQIAQIKKEINDYYVHEEEEIDIQKPKNIAFEEPDFPEITEEVDIDALDESSNILSEIIKTGLTNEEEDYLNSFDNVETFSADSEILLEDDPAIEFLSNEESYSDYEESDIEESIEEEPEVYKPEVVEDVPVPSIELEDPEIVKTEKRVLFPSEDSYDDLNNVDDYIVPVEGILNKREDHSYEEIDDATKRSAAILEQTLEEFNIKGKVTGIKKGPVITMFELLPAPGVKLSKIVNLSDNIALGLAASSVRIVAPIPGKHAVGIEVPNKKRSIVTFNELIDAKDKTYDDGAIPIVLGKSINGDDKIIDLAKTPHLLIAGATGAGKSVCVNSLICSILCKRSPQDVKLIMVDPKIVELKLYNGIPHLLTPVITDPKRAYQAIQWCLYEMERRYALLDSMGVRDIKTYNKRIKEQSIATTKIPYLVLIVDEFADLMATSGKELEGILARLAAMSRAVGIHLVLATQRPSIDVITGLIKANFPSRIAFMVSSKTDSRIILDGMGAEKLLGRGDMLFSSSWDPFPVRIQGSFLDDEEVEGIVDYVKTFGEPDYIDDEIFIDDSDDSEEDSDKSFFGDDPLYNRALEVVLTAGKASASFLQRRLKIGYNRAARLIEEMEERGIIGPQNGSKPRDILKVPDSHREVSEFV